MGDFTINKPHLHKNQLNCVSLLSDNDGCCHDVNYTVITHMRCNKYVLHNIQFTLYLHKNNRHIKTVTVGGE